MRTISDIDTNTPEGMLLLVTLSRLSCKEGYSDKTPDEILQEMEDLAAELYPKTLPEEKIERAIEMIVQYGGIGGEHHKAWTIDQVLKILSGDRYERIIKEYMDGEDGPCTYTWDVGIAP